MVYRPKSGTASRAVSQNRQSISQEEEEFRRKSAATAANRMLSGSSVQQTPSPMPTGNRAPPTKTGVSALVNSAPAAAQAAAGPQATMPTNTSQYGTQSGNARMGILDDIFGFLGDTFGSDTAAPARTGESDMQVDEEGQRENARNRGAGDLGYVLDGEGGSATAGALADRGGIRANVGTRGRLDPYTALPFQNDGGGAGIDLTGSGAAQDVTSPIYEDGTDGGSSTSEDSPFVEDRTFRNRLEELLVSKLDESADERAAKDAGRAIAAARAQGGRGQMGMSGGMIGLQSDIATSASERARESLFGEQMTAARRGVQLEALDKAESLGLLQYLSTTSMSREEAIKFIEDFMDIDTETAASIANAAIPEGGEIPEEEDDTTPIEEDDPSFLDHILDLFNLR